MIRAQNRCKHIFEGRLHGAEAEDKQGDAGETTDDSATGHTSVFSNLTLIWVPRVRSFHMAESDRSADFAAPRRARISVLQVADSSIMDPNVKLVDLLEYNSTASDI